MLWSLSFIVRETLALSVINKRRLRLRATRRGDVVAHCVEKATCNVESLLVIERRKVCGVSDFALFLSYFSSLAPMLGLVG